MIDTPTSANIADFKQRYQGVMGWFSPKNLTEKYAVYVASVSAAKVTFKDVNDNEYYANVNGGVQFEFLPTQRSWSNTADQTFLVHRIPARQWKRGVCPDNTSILRAGKAGTIVAVSDNWRQCAFDIMAAGITYEEATAMWVNKGRSSVAFSKHFAVVDTTLYFLNLIAGSIQDNRKVVLNSSMQMVRQELTDLIRRNNLNLEIAQ